MAKPLAVAVVAVFVLLATDSATSLEGPRLVRVIAFTVAEQGDTDETSDVLFVNQELRGSAGNLVGRGVQQCMVGLEGVSTCLSTFVLKRGEIMAQGTRRRRDFYVWAITGGTGIYSNVGGSLVARTLSLGPRRERLLISVEP